MAGEGERGGGRKRRALVVGHYCHDVLKLSSGREVESLGGSVSYITNILDVLGMESTVVSKVGSDFKYPEATTTHPPSKLLPPAQTTRFYADFTTGNERLLRVSNACDPIHPSDIPYSTQYSIGLAVGVAGEILPETLRRMVEVSDVVVADIQALIRTIDPSDGIVGLKKLCDTEFYDLIEDISFIKASTMEAAFLDIEEVRQRTCVIVTEGKGGCRVYDRDREFHVAAFEAEEVDPTGAGDSFLAGFSAGLMRGLSVVEAARMGNFFGSITVAHIGLPQFSHHHLVLLQQRLQEEVLDRRIKNGIYCSFKVDCTHSPTLMDSFNFSNLPIVEDQFLQQDLDKATENNICLHTNMDSMEFLKSSKGEEVDDFLTVTSATERQNVPEESDKNKHSV